MNETYDYSKTNVIKHKAAARRQEQLKLLAALLLILVLVIAWAYQAMTGISVVDEWNYLSDTTRKAVQLGLMVVAGVTLMLWAASE